jgi:hypothetical protein
VTLDGGGRDGEGNVTGKIPRGPDGFTTYFFQTVGALLVKTYGKRWRKPEPLVQSYELSMPPS